MTSRRHVLLLLFGALAAIALLAAVLTVAANKRHASSVRASGTALVRLLAGMEFERLAPAPGRSSVIESVRPLFAASALSYIAVYANDSNLLTFTGQLPGNTSQGIADSPLTSGLVVRNVESNDGKPLTEFSSPLLSDGEIVGSIHVAFVRPTFAVSTADLAILAQLALPVMLLLLLFYYLLRQQTRPLEATRARVEKMAAHLGEPLDGQPTVDIRTLAANFERIIQLAEARLIDAQTKQADLVMQQRLVAYEKARVESSLQAIPDGIMIVTEAGLPSFINDNLSMMLKVTRDMVIDKAIANWCKEASMARFLAGVGGKSGVRRVEMIEIPPGPHCDKTLAISAVPLFSPKDATTVYGSVVLFRDISAEAHARSARDEFVAHVAHEIKNPLNVINMQAETLAEFGAESSELRVTAINVIQDEVDRLSHMIGDLLNITKIEAGSLAPQRSPVKLRELLEDAFVSTMRSGEARAIVPRLDLPRHLPTILADKDLLRLAVNNLLTNAIKYNRDGGTVTLKAVETDACVIVEVTDEGVGIAAADQHKIFDKFYRSDDPAARAREGHGLGLSLAKQVIEMHSGSLTVESEPDVGSTFSITLEKEIHQLQEAV